MVPENPRESSGFGRLLVTAALSLACGFLAAWSLRHFSAGRTGPRAKDSSTARALAGKSDRDRLKAEVLAFAKQAEKPSPSHADEEKVRERTRELGLLRTRIGEMAGRIDRLDDQLAAAVKSNDSPELTALRVKVPELAEAANEVAALPDRTNQIGSQIDQVHAELETLRNELARLRENPEPAPSAGEDQSK